MLLAALFFASALAEDPTATESFECDGSVEFCARLQKALELGEQLESVVEREAFEGVEQVHHREAVVRKHLRPHPPIEASVQFKEPTRCAYRVFIDEKGYAYDLRFLNCPDLFHACVLEALPNARWEPIRKDGKKVKATFATSYTFD